MSRNAELSRRFAADWRVHTRGGWPARWRRRAVWPALFAQKLGLHLRVPARLFWGEHMRVLTGETASRMLLSFGYSESALTALLCDLIAPGQSVIDIGTHFGYEAMLMAQLTGPTGSVHAFEPNPEVAAFAVRNLASTRWAQLHEAAVSDKCGRTSFAVPPLIHSAFGGISGADSRRIEVALQTLDQVLDDRATPVALIKCDAEGHEEAILRGASRLITKDRPVLILETGMPDEQGKSSTAAHRLAALLAPAGYHAFSFDFAGELKVAKLDAFPTGHANTLYLPATHSRFADYTAGLRSSPDKSAIA